MTNVEKLGKIGILEDIRKRYGVENGHDVSQDDYINSRDNDELVSAWCAWKLGSPEWWIIMKNIYDRLNSLS